MDYANTELLGFVTFVCIVGAVLVGVALLVVANDRQQGTAMDTLNVTSVRTPTRRPG